ncbi:nucleotide modification associated domain-containing protein [uncultured Eubacterium sp.]|uniref:nucleotide modification associated domain-containing protein n=1 Tax=uncultured Eubacterium sp. TaxID=165185 RepID=UPI002599263A|nr:nucleotide modification associated domain-containing protein [uncultured Eubacterium sp.]
MKEKCDDKQWMHCRVEKMGCDGCHYEDRPLTEKETIFQNYLNQMWDLYSKKNHDYGDSVSKTFDEYGLTSFLVRMDDKMNRIKTLMKSDDVAVVGEKIEDTFLDLANYAILALTEIKDRKKKLLLEQVEIDPDVEMRKEEIKFDYEQRHKGDN